ncbi:MAG: VPLPA-CTERM sorting domain-containing protein [Pseudomonadota bacterium]
MARFCLSLAATVFVIALGGMAKAATVVAPVSVTTDLDPLSAAYDVNNVINQSGLSTGYTSGVTDFSTYIATNPTEPNGTGFTFAGELRTFSGNFVFDLGGLYSVSQLALWNRGPSLQGIQDFSLYSSDTSGFAGGSLISSFTASAGVSNSAAASNGARLQVFGFAETQARFIRLEVSSVYGNCCVSLSEVAFDGAPVSAVPVPASLPLLAVGFIALGALGRRKRITSLHG